MSRKKKLYVSPDCETAQLEQESLLCYSGDVPDVTPFDPWEDSEE